MIVVSHFCNLGFYLVLTKLYSISILDAFFSPAIVIVLIQKHFVVAEIAQLGDVRSEGPWGPFSKAPESFGARKAIFRSSLSKNGEVYTLETSCMKETSLHL